MRPKPFFVDALHKLHLVLISHKTLSSYHKLHCLPLVLQMDAFKHCWDLVVGLALLEMIVLFSLKAVFAPQLNFESF
jgi:hypothetical protein